MSLLDKGRETITLYPEVQTVDSDGNPFRTHSDVGIDLTVRIQKLGESGTAARRAEQDNEGFESERLAIMRLTRADEEQYGPLGRLAELDWHGERWTVFGDVQRYNGSDRTAHNEYTLKRG